MISSRSIRRALALMLLAPVACLTMVDCTFAEEHGTTTESHGDTPHTAESPNPLKIDPDLAVWTLVVFVVLLIILRLVAWKPIVEALEKREKGITGEIAAAADKHEEAKRLLAAHEMKLATAADQIRELLEEARRDAEHTKQEILAEAKNAANAEKQRAVREVELARDAALKQLAETSANMAITLASNAVRQSLTPEQQSRIVRDSLSMIGNGASSQN